MEGTCEVPSVVLDAIPEEQFESLPLADEWANALTHGIGFILSLVGTYILLETVWLESDGKRWFSFLVYAISLILLYGASTSYHCAKRASLKNILRTVDHCCIYLLIAGSYTPFTLLVLDESSGWPLFAFVWITAMVGIVFKIFFTHRFRLFSTGLYLLMGWAIVIVSEPLSMRMSFEGLTYLLFGGLAYTTGVIFFLLDKKYLYHAIWHLFVLGGSVCHYLAILWYI